MPVRLPVVNPTRIAVAAALLSAACATSAPAQNPFAPKTPATAPATTPAPAAPATTSPATATPAANPFASPTPAATAPAPAPAATPAAPAPAATAAGAPAAAATLGVTQGPPPSGGYRVLARGVETTIPSPVTADDLSSRHNLVEILAVNSAYGERPAVPALKPAQNVHFKHDVWGLVFTFKPIRFLRVPGADGKERLIWYMVYHVKNGPVKRYVDDPNDPDPNVLIPEPVTEPFLFIPRFELESHDVKQTYSEKLLPEVVPLIQAREDKNRKLLNTAQITGEIPPSTAEADRSAWGVVTWEGVDPRTDRFTIYVHGLTNAYRWEDPAGVYKIGDPPGKGRTYHYQVLKINFWRPSDARDEHEEEIRFGIPGEVDYAWFYK